MYYLLDFTFWVHIVATCPPSRHIQIMALAHARTHVMQIVILTMTMTFTKQVTQIGQWHRFCKSTKSKINYSQFKIRIASSCAAAGCTKTANDQQIKAENTIGELVKVETWKVSAELTGDIATNAFANGFVTLNAENSRKLLHIFFVLTHVSLSGRYVKLLSRDSHSFSFKITVIHIC